LGGTGPEKESVKRHYGGKEIVRPAQESRMGLGARPSMTNVNRGETGKDQGPGNGH